MSAAAPPDRPLVAGIEGGGTKFVCAVGTGPDDLRAELTFPTTTPQETLGRVADFLDERSWGEQPIAAVGFGSFGPLGLDPDADDHGTITGLTPKPGWPGFDVLGTVQAHVGVPVALATDVQAAAVGESRWGAARGDGAAVYVTVGTGVGGAVVVDGRPVGRARHPELGHVPVTRHPTDPYPGNCAVHGDCLEGLAAGPAVAERWGVRAEELDGDLPAARDLEAWYLGQLVTSLLYSLAPDRIILGGGVMQLPELLPAVRRATEERQSGYAAPADLEPVVVAPQLGRHAGVLGAIALAQDLLADA